MPAGHRAVRRTFQADCRNRVTAALQAVGFIVIVLSTLWAPGAAAGTLAGPGLPLVLCAQSSGPLVQVEIAANDPDAVREKAEDYYDEARDLYRDEDYDAARTKLQRVLILVPDHKGAQELLEDIDREQAAAEREAKIEGLLTRAEQYRERGELNSARQAAEEALALEEGNRDARRELDRIDELQEAAAQATEEAAAEATRTAREAAEQMREQQIEALLAQAEQLKDEGNLAQARAKLNNVLALDEGNREAERELERIADLEEAAAEATREAEAEMTKTAREVAAERREEEIETLLDEADALKDNGEFNQARVKLNDVLALDEGNREAERELERIADLEEAAAEATREAVAEMTKTAQEAAAERLEEQLETLLDEADELKDNGDFAQARAKLNEVLALDEGNREAERGLERIGKLEEAAAEATREAVAEMTKTAQEEAAERREAKIDNLLDAADELAAAEKFADARKKLHQVLELDASNAQARDALEDLAEEEAEAEQEQLEQQVENLVDQAERQADEGDFDAALTTLAQAETLLPDHRAIERAREDIQQEKQRAAEEQAEQEARAREQRAEELLDQAEEQLDRDELEQARTTLAEAAELTPGSRAIERLLQEIDERERELAAQAQEAETEKQEAEQEQQLRERLALAERYYSEGRLDDALREFEVVLAVDPENETALNYSERIRQDQARQEAAAEEAAQQPVAMADESAPEDTAAAAKEVEEDTADTDEQLQAALARGEAYYKAGQLDKAEAEFQKVLALQPDHDGAQSYLEKIAEDRKAQDEARAEADAADAAEAQAEAAEKAQKLFDVGMQQYIDGDVIAAVETWQRALELDPANETIETYLDNTEQEYQQAVQQQQAREQVQAQETQYDKRMNEPTISLELKNRPLDTVVNVLGTYSGFNIIAGDGVEGTVTLNIKDKSLKEVLDMMLTRYGFSWERDGNDIFIRPAHKVKTFQLNEEQYNKLRKILDDPETLQEPSQALQYLLYPDSGQPQVQGRLLQLNDNTRTLLVKDSDANIARVEQFLENIPPLVGKAEPLINRQYVMNPNTSQKVYNLLKLALYGDKQLAGTNPRGRLLLLDDDTDILIVKDTKENIETLERILEDQKLMEAIQRGELLGKQFRITDDLEDTPESRARRREIVEQTMVIIEAMLYGREGRQAAAAVGRQMFANVNNGTIDIVDTPSNIKKVENYLQTVRGGVQEEVALRRIPVRHADPFYVANFIGSFLLNDTSGARQVYIQESVNVTSTGRARAGRGGGSAGGGGFNALSPTQRGGRELSSKLLGSQPENLAGNAMIQIEPNTATMVVMTNDPQLLSWIEQMVEFLDVRPRQVEIEARLVEVDLSEARERGGELGISFGEGLGEIHDIGDILDWPGTVDFLRNQAGQSQISISSVGGKTQVDVLFQFLNQLESTEVLSAPKIVSKSAPDFVPSIVIATQEPYIERAEFDDQGDDDPTNNRINFDFATEIVGIQLMVYPVITGDDHVYLDMLPNVSVLTGRLPVVVDFGNAADVPGALNVGSLGVPIIDKRVMYNSTVLNDGDTVILGGLTRDELVESVRRMPGLSRIPLLGTLFKQTSKSTVKGTLLIFVTVNIIKE